MNGLVHRSVIGLWLQACQLGGIFFAVAGGMIPLGPRHMASNIAARNFIEAFGVTRPAGPLGVRIQLSPIYAIGSW